MPLQLRTNNESGTTTIWTNPAPSSTRFCKPIRIQFVKETKVTLQLEEKYVLEQISTLVPSVVYMGNGNVLRIRHSLCMTMIDGKARTILADTSSMATCCACGATPSLMAVDKVILRPVDVSTFKYGLSVLHARIRFLELALHVAYKLELKK